MKVPQLKGIWFNRLLDKINVYGKRFPAATFIYPLLLCVFVVWVNTKFPIFNDTIALQFAAVVILTAWFSGLLISLGVIVAAVVLMDQFFLDPNNHLQQDIIFLAVFIPAALIMSSIISGQRRAYETAHRMALYDSLTGLPNRRLLNEKINMVFEMAKRNRSQFAVIFIDVDDFKAINDSYGHHVGDMVLRYTAENLQKNSRAEDVISRYGGDEFVIVLNNVSGEIVAQVIDRIIKSFAQAFSYEGITTDLSISMGVAYYPEHGDSYEQVMRQADKALYKAKAIQNSSFVLAEKS